MNTVGPGFGTTIPLTCGVVLHLYMSRCYIEVCCSTSTSADSIMVGVHVNRVAVIGAGPAGAIAVDALAQEKAFDIIRVFERREGPGGCWCVLSFVLKLARDG